MADRVKVSQLVGQAETQLNQIRTSQIIAQVEYVLISTGVHISQIIAQVEYTESGPAPEGPVMAQLMRHGTWFGSGVKQKMWWAR